MTLNDSELISSNIKTASQPSKLKITDMRLVRTTTGGPILKIDTITYAQCAIILIYL